ncbi:HNH endonuclease [Chryseobacterium indoltheticum]|uniref:HNH endonuclease n=1 Tax=Chryseobacterium indoltheticum TaxID=254 RepID=A0A381FCZ2_9FLAO|nr:hypothetical protein EG358_08375 [Chryseobacterium indoltheticum]SIQ94450.1 HNH endonuclease [Chryseobacterium indoltheticum]SUX43952.1 Uncharacterised protein [Chryseobacterium indoltheticum]
MLYINEYSKALDFYKKIVPCWLKIKIHGVSRIKEGDQTKCTYCDTTECENLKTKNHNYSFDESVKDLLKVDIIDKLLLSEPRDLVILTQQIDAVVLEEKETVALEDLFKKSGYKTFFQTNNGREFLNHLNRSTCSYCNRNYTINITSKNASAQLDHWFPKDKFPFLALSFFNLIPSCSSCNHMKGNSDKDKGWWSTTALDELIHPYFEEADHKFKFDFNFEKSTNNLFVLFRDVEGDKTMKTLKFNLTKEIYQAHSELELRDLYDLRKKYSKNYLKYLLKILHKHEPSEAEKYRMLFNVEKNEKDYHKRPFSKFKNDIIEQLLKIDNKKSNL